ncbi:V-snare-domain-containing protein [Meredithblackwellia eburnea MCA 4105]
MSTAFEQYGEEWSQVQASVNSKLDKDVKQQTGEQRKATLRRINMELEEADEILDQMELEAKGKARQMIVVRSNKAEVKKLRDRVLKESMTSDRDALLAQPAHSAYAMDVDESDTYSATQAQRTRLLNSTQTLRSTDARLDRSSRLAAESEAIGGSVLESLRGQGAQLAHARDTLDEADGIINRASGTIKKMVRQMYKTRITIIAFIAVLVALIGLILWNKFR